MKILHLLICVVFVAIIGINAYDSVSIKSDIKNSRTYCLSEYLHRFPLFGCTDIKLPDEAANILRDAFQCPEESPQVLIAEALKGNAAAYTKLAILLAYGTHELSADDELACRFFLTAAEKGDRDAQLGLWAILLSGRCGDVGFSTAMEWYRQMAQDGVLLGMLMLHTFGDDEAAHWRKQALSINAQAWTQLEKQFMTFIIIGANEQIANFQRVLGRVYMEGRLGMTIDRRRAEYWFTEACKNGDEVSKKILKNVNN